MSGNQWSRKVKQWRVANSGQRQQKSWESWELRRMTRNSKHYITNDI